MANSGASRALYQSILGEEHLDKLRRIAPPMGPRALVVCLGGNARVPQARPGEVVTFYPFLLAGLVPPFSEFFIVVLTYYNIHLTHLIPNFILMLAIFVHLCEQFLGAAPNLTLFRSLYTLRSGNNRHMVGSCAFCLHDADVYIPMPLKDKWNTWSRQWLYIEAEVSVSNLTWPERPAATQDSWGEPVEALPELELVKARLTHLRQAGLTGAMVIGDFVNRRSPIEPFLYVTESYHVYFPTDPKAPPKSL